MGEESGGLFSPPRYRSATGTVLLRSSWHQNAQHSWHQNAQLAPERTGGLHSEMLYILLSVAAAANVALPASASGTLHVLLLGSKPVARSYDGHAWERTQGGATMDLRCEGASCVATIAEGAPYKIESHDGPSRRAAEQA